MPKYIVTKNMGASLRNLRTKRNIKAIDIAKSINKTGAYISKLENGVLNTIEQKDLFNIIDTLCKDKDEKNEAISLLLNDTTMEFSKEESENEEWKLNLDFFYRQLPIPEEYKKFVIDKISNLNISLDELVTYINSNFDLYGDPTFPDDLLNNAEKNHWYFNNGHSFILVEMTVEDVKDVLYRENITTNYSMLKCLLISLFRIEKFSKKEAYLEADKILTNLEIQTLSEKEEIMNTYDKANEMHSILDQRNNKNLPTADRKLLTSLYEFTQQIHSFAQIYDIDYANKKLSTLITNFTNDPVLLMGFIGIDLNDLKDCDLQIKKEFVNAIKDLIAEYSIKKPDTNISELI